MGGVTGACRVVQLYQYVVLLQLWLLYCPGVLRPQPERLSDSPYLFFGGATIIRGAGACIPSLCTPLAQDRGGGGGDWLLLP